jgi:hypothetical protein
VRSAERGEKVVKRFLVIRVERHVCETKASVRACGNLTGEVR